MRVFVAGASGAIGTPLVTQLIQQGHDVTGSFKTPGHGERISALGAQAVRLDLLDKRAVREAIMAAQPDAIIHQATALTEANFSRSLDKTFGVTNRLRTEGTDVLLDAASAARVRRFVAQSFASLRYAREGGLVKTEADRLDPAPVKPPARPMRLCAIWTGP
jgi:nucleoside-diphosphate-sugar epimerase